MSDAYHALLQARHEARCNVGDSQSRADASNHLMHLVNLGMEAGLLQIEIQDKEKNSAYFQPTMISTDDQDVIIIGGSLVIGHSGDIPRIDCNHEQCQIGKSRSFHEAFGAASMANNPTVAAAVAELRIRATALRNAGDIDNADALDAIARRLDVVPLAPSA